MQVDGATLLDMVSSDAALEELGVDSAIHRSRIRSRANAIAAVRGTVRKRTPDPAASGAATGVMGAPPAESPREKRARARQQLTTAGSAAAGSSGPVDLVSALSAAHGMLVYGAFLPAAMPRWRRRSRQRVRPLFKEV